MGFGTFFVLHVNVTLPNFYGSGTEAGLGVGAGGAQSPHPPSNGSIPFENNRTNNRNNALITKTIADAAL